MNVIYNNNLIMAKTVKNSSRNSRKMSLDQVSGAVDAALEPSSDGSL